MIILMIIMIILMILIIMIIIIITSSPQTDFLNLFWSMPDVIKQMVYNLQKNCLALPPKKKHNK